MRKHHITRTETDIMIEKAFEEAFRDNVQGVWNFNVLMSCFPHFPSVTSRHSKPPIIHLPQPTTSSMFVSARMHTINYAELPSREVVNTCRIYAKAEPNMTASPFHFIPQTHAGQNVPNEGRTKRSMIDDLLRFADEL